MKVNFEKKHLYAILGVLVLLFSSAYVIAQSSTFISLPWDATKQSHEVLYTDIITSKSTANPRQVNIEAELIAKDAISLGGVKRTAWPSESTAGGQECYVVQRSQDNANGDNLHTLCNSVITSDLNKVCTNPTQYTTYTELVNDWCSLGKGGCTIQVYDIVSPWNGDYDWAYLYQYLTQGNTCGFAKEPGSALINYCISPTTDITYIRTAADPECSFKYGNDVIDRENPINPTTFSGFYFYMAPRSSGVLRSEGCALTICNNG